MHRHLQWRVFTLTFRVYGTPNGKKPTVEDCIIDVLRDFPNHEFHWMTIQQEIKNRFGLWIRGTTLARTCARLVTKAEYPVKSDRKGRFWWNLPKKETVAHDYE